MVGILDSDRFTCLEISSDNSNTTAPVSSLNPLTILFFLISFLSTLPAFRKKLTNLLLPTMALSLAVLLFCSTVSATWWNTSFDARQAIDVNMTENVTNFPVLLNITYTCNMQPTFEDLRFANHNNTIEYPYWIEKKVDSDYADVWVNATMDTYNGTQIYVYYKNTTEVMSHSNGNDTFIFFDDFSGGSIDTTKWKGYTTGATVSGGILTFDGSGDWQYLYSIYEPSPDMRVVFKSMFESTTAYSAFIGYLIAGENGHAELFNQGALRTADDSDNIETTTGHPWTDLVNYYRTETQVVSGTSVKVYYNHVLDATHTTEVFTTSKNISIGSYSSVNSVFVDYVFAPSYITTEPVITYNGEESYWWNKSWNKRKNITIDHTKVTDDLTYFPVLINIYDSDLKDHAQSDGDDIVFANSSNNGKLPHEIELYNNTYNSTHAHLVAWVNIPTLSSTTDSLIHIYYDNAIVSDQQNVTGVWDSDYKAVVHMNDNSTTTVLDSAERLEHDIQKQATQFQMK